MPYLEVNGRAPRDTRGAVTNPWEGKRLATHENRDIRRPRELSGKDSSTSASADVWAWCAILALAYGSLIPFDFDWPAMARWAGWEHYFPHWVLGGPEDVVANFLIYVPVGWIVVWFARTRRSGVVVELMLAGAACFLLSAGLECAQTVIRSRVASWWDVVLNGSGGLFGAALALAIGRRVVAVLRRQIDRASRNPAGTAATALTLAIIVVSFLPSDLTVSTGELREAFLHADWHLSFAAALSPGSEYMMGYLNELTWFGLLSYVSFRACRRRRESVVTSLFRAVQHVTIVAALIEFLQLFSSGHVFSFNTILVRVAGGILGAAVAILIADARAARGMAHTSSSATLRRRGILSCLAVIALLGVYGWAAPSAVEGHAALRVRWCPFVEAWRGSFVLASVTGMATLTQYGVLGGALRSLLRRSVSHCPSLVPVVLVAVFATLAEVLTSWMTDSVVDTTMPVLAVTGAVAANALFVRIHLNADPEPA